MSRLPAKSTAQNNNDLNIAELMHLSLPILSVTMGVRAQAAKLQDNKLVVQIQSATTSMIQHTYCQIGSNLVNHACSLLVQSTRRSALQLSNYVQNYFRCSYQDCWVDLRGVEFPVTVVIDQPPSSIHAPAFVSQCGAPISISTACVMHACHLARPIFQSTATYHHVS